MIRGIVENVMMRVSGAGGKGFSICSKERGSETTSLR